MTDQHSLRVPDQPGFEMTYYFSNGAQQVEPHVFPAHIHDVPEIYILAGGSACFAVEDRVYRLEAGDVIVARPNEMHNCILTEPSTHRHLCFWFDPGFFLLDRILESCTASGNRISPSPEGKQRLLQQCEELAMATEEGQHRKEYAVLCRILWEIEAGIGAPSEAETTVPQTLARILEDVNQNFTSIESVDYFRKKYYLSQSTLNRLFQTHLHTSPRTYLETKKLARSRILLRDGASVSEAAAMSGFSDASGFIRLFRKRFGVTPGEYKRGKALPDR